MYSYPKCRNTITSREVGSSMATQNKKIGYIIALIGGALAILAFFALPFVAIGPFSVTGEQVASIGISSGYSSNSGQGVAFLWLAPVIAAVILVIAGLQLRSSNRSSTKRAPAGWLIGLTVLTLIILALFYLGATQISAIGVSGASLLGAGFWVYTLSIFAAFIGGIMEVRRKPATSAVQTPASPWQSPPQPWQQPAQPTAGPSPYPPTAQYRQPQSSPASSPYQQYPQSSPNPPYQQYPQPSQYPPSQQSSGSQWQPGPPNQ